MTDPATRRTSAPAPRPGTVLFLCTGNYYRSRFAEILFNHCAAAAGLPWRAASRGLAPAFGDNLGPLASCAVKRLTALGVRHEEYLRAPLGACEEDLTAADLIVALKEAEHRPLLQELFPAWAERAEYWHVHDLDCAPPAEALPGLERAVRELVARLGEGANGR